MPETNSTNDPLLDPANPSAPSSTPPVEDPLKGIKDKYGNNIDKLAKAYQDTQSAYTKSIPPKEYTVGDEFKELDEFTINSSLATAKEGAYTQKQLDALLNSAKTTITNFNKATADQSAAVAAARKEALGSDEEVEQLKAFFINKVPEGLLNEVINSGDPSHIKQLKQFRNSQINTGTPAPTGGNMPDNSLDRRYAVEKYRERLIEISAELEKAPIEKQGALRQEQKKLANEIVALQRA